MNGAAGDPHVEVPGIPLQEVAGGSYIELETWIQIRLVLKAGLKMSHVSSVSNT